MKLNVTCRKLNLPLINSIYLVLVLRRLVQAKVYIRFFVRSQKKEITKL